MKKFDIMKSVELSDLGNIEVAVFPQGHITINFVPLDKTKKLVFDTSALKTLNEKATDLARGKDASDPKVKQFIAEYVHRMIIALHKNGLCELVPITEGPEDWYSGNRN